MDQIGMNLMKDQEHLRDGDTVCPYCGGSGWEMYEKIIDGQDYPYSRECRCKLLTNHRVDSRLRFLSMPKIYLGCGLKDFKLSVYQTEQGKKLANIACKSVKYWLDNLNVNMESGRGLYFYSRTKGSGKSFMAACIANELIVHNMRVKYATSMEILNEIKASWDDNYGRTETELLSALSEAEVLILDDFGVEQEDRKKGWIDERFFQVINKRYINKKVTIFTSNASVADLNYDDRVRNRILQIVFQIPFPEESVREQIGQNNQKELFKSVM